LINVHDILVGHVTLDVECLDRIYLNGYVPNLQVGGQVVQYLRARGFPIPSPAVIERMGLRFRDAVHTFAIANHIPVVRFGKHDRKITVMEPYVARQAATGRSGVAAIGVAQEFQRVATCTTKPAAGGGAPHFAWDRADRRVTCFYFYLWDEDFGPAFIKVCAYFPYPIKVWVNFAGDLRPARARHDHGVRGALVGPAAAAARAGGPGRRVLVGAVDAADRGLPHAGVRPPAQRPGVLRRPGR